MLTKEQKRRYVESGYAHCPYCSSDDLTGSSVDVDGNVATQGVSCAQCCKSWTDVFRLVNIVED